jgi:hypothetical protein
MPVCADRLQGFGATAKSTEESRNADPAAIVIFHQADLGEVSYPYRFAGPHVFSTYARRRPLPNQGVLCVGLEMQMKNTAHR